MDTLNKYTANVSNILNVNQFTNEIVIDLDRELKFAPGQYVWASCKSKDNPNSEIIKKMLWIGSYAKKNTQISLFLNSEQSRDTINLSIGDEFQIEGPFGEAVDLKSATNFIVEDSYIAPLLSKIRFHINFPSALNQSLNVVIIKGQGLSDYIKQEIEQFKKVNPDYVLKYSNNVNDINLHFLLNSEEATKSYIIGSVENVSQIENAIINLHIAKNNIFYIGNFPIKKGEQYLKPEDFMNPSGYSLFRNIVEQSSTHMIVTDVNGKIVYANKSAEALTGYKFKEMIGHTPRLWGGLMEPGVYKKMWKAIKEDKIPYKSEITNRDKEGKNYRVAATITPIFSTSGDLIAFLGTEEDITHHINLEEQLRSKTKDLERLNKLMVDRELKMIELKKIIKSTVPKPK